MLKMLFLFSINLKEILPNIYRCILLCAVIVLSRITDESRVPVNLFVLRAWWSMVDPPRSD